MLNKQVKRAKDGTVTSRGIEWTDYTFNPVGGCLHGCKWDMPDGSTAVCYAKTVAERVAQRAYENGFEYHYWRPGTLKVPSSAKEPSRFFIDSMSDLFGHWVPEEQIVAVMEMCNTYHQHTFQSLTKNPKRLLEVAEKIDYPRNLWIGFSSPPDEMWGHALTRKQQEKMLHVALETLSLLRGGLYEHPVCWMSAEPLSWDIAPIIAQYPHALAWCVIGAASNGNTYYQPDQKHLVNLLDVLDEQKVPVFFKGNMRASKAASPWREMFPGFVPTEWNRYAQ